MRLMLALLAFLVFPATTATAQEYKCQNGGKVYLAQYPCPGNEFKESAAPPTYRRAPAATPSHEAALENSTIVQQSNSMIAAALAQRDFAKAERLAVTKKQWDMIDAAMREAQRERSEAEARADIRALREAAERPTVCKGTSYIDESGYTQSVQKCRKKESWERPY